MTTTNEYLLSGTVGSRLSAYGCKLHLFIIGLAIIAAQYGYHYKSQPIIIIVSVFVIFYTMLLDSENQIYILMIIMPANRILTFGDISVNVIIIFIFCLVALTLKKRTIPASIAFLAVIFLLFSLSYAFRYGSYHEFMSAVKSAAAIFFCYLAFTDKHTFMPRAIKNISLSLCGGLIINAFARLIFTDVVIGSRFSFTDSSHANVLATICAFTIAMLVINYTNRPLPRIKLSFLLILAVSLIGMLTVSRTFFIGFAMIIIWMLLPGSRCSSSNKIALFVFVTLCGLIVLYMYFWGTSSISALVQRGINRIVFPARDDITNGRVDIWMEYLAAWKEKPFSFIFGVGIDYTRNGMDMMAHNMILEAISDWGIFGLALVLWLYITAIKRLIRELKNKYFFSGLYSFLPLVIILSSGMFSHSFLANNVTLQIFVSLSVLYCIPREKQIPGMVNPFLKTPYYRTTKYSSIKQP